MVRRNFFVHLLVFLLLFTSFAHAGITFGSRNAAIEITSGTTFNIVNSGIDFGGTLIKANNGSISGGTVTFESGLFEENRGEFFLNAQYDPASSEIRLAGTQSNPHQLRAEPGPIFQTIKVQNTYNTLEGQPILYQPVQLLDSSASLTVAIHGALDQNIELNSGTLYLDNDLELADGIKLSNGGIVDLNGHSLKFGGRVLTLTDSIYWDSPTDIHMNSKISLSGTWTFSNTGNLNGNGNILDLTNGGTLYIESGATLYLTDVIVKGIGSGWITMADQTSQIRLANVTFETTTTYTVWTGGVYVEGLTNFNLRDKNWHFDGNSSLTVDGTVLWTDRLNTPTVSRGEITFGTPEANYLGLINSGTIRARSALEDYIDLEDRLVDCINDVETFESRMDTAETDINSLQADMVEAQSDVDDNTTAINNNSSAIITNANDISTNAGDISTNATGISNNLTAINNNSGAIVTHETRIDAHDTSIANNETAITNNSNAIVVHETRLDTAETDIVNNSNAIVTHETRIDAHDTSIANNETAITNNSNAIVVHETRLDTAETDIVNNSNAIVTHETRIDTHDTSIANNETAITNNSNAIVAHETRLDTAETDIVNNSNAIATHETRIDAHDTSIANNETAITNNSNAIVAHETRLDTAETDIVNNSNAIATHETRIDAHDTSIANNETAITNNSNAIVVHETRLDTAETDIVNNSNAIVTHETRIDAHDTSIANNETAITNNSNAIIVHETRLDTAETDIVNNSNAIVTHETRIDAHDTSIANNETAITNNSNAIVVHETRLDTAETDIVNNSNAIVTHETRIDAHDTSIANNETAITNNSNAIVVHETRLDTAETDIVNNSNAIITHETRIDGHDSDISTIQSNITGNDTDITRIDGYLGSIDHGPNNLVFDTNSTLSYDLWISQDHTCAINENMTLNGDGHLMHFAKHSPNTLNIAASKTLTLQHIRLKDFDPADVQLGAGSNIIFGNGTSVEITSTVNSTFNWIFDGTTAINGCCNSLYLDNKTLTIQPSSSLMINNVNLRDVKDGNINGANNSSQIIYRDSSLILSSTYSFTTGSMQIEGDVAISGTNAFIYQTDQQSTIASHAALKFALGTTFSYIPSNWTKTLITMTDNTSALEFAGCTVYTQTNGLQLTKGRLVVDHVNYITNEASSSPLGLTFGDGTYANNLSIDVLPGGRLKVINGILNYQNID